MMEQIGLILAVLLLWKILGGLPTPTNWPAVLLVTVPVARYGLVLGSHTLGVFVVPAIVGYVILKLLLVQREPINSGVFGFVSMLSLYIAGLMCGWAVSGNPSLSRWEPLIIPFLVAVGLILTVRTSTDVDTVIVGYAAAGLIAAASVLLAALGLAQLQFLEIYRYEFQRHGGLFGNPVVAAVFIISAAPSVVRAIWLSSNRKSFRGLALAAAAVTLALAILHTGSLTGVALAAAGTPILLIWLVPRRHTLAMLMVFALLLIPILLLAGSEVSRFGGGSEDLTIERRSDRWLEGVQTYQQSALLGLGPGAVTHEFGHSSEMLYVEAAAEGGLIAILGLLGLILWALTSSYSGLFDAARRRILVVTLLAWLAAGVTLPIGAEEYFWISLVVAGLHAPIAANEFSSKMRRAGASPY